MRNVFLDPTGREIYLWDEVAIEAVRTLRVAIGHDLDDPRLTDLVGELSLKSDDFRRLWGRQEIREKTIGHKHFNNPFVGPIALEYESLTINDSAAKRCRSTAPNLAAPTNKPSHCSLPWLRAESR